MKTIVLSLLLFTLISCQPDLSRDSHLRHKNLLKEKIVACISNSTASDTLKNAFKENNDSSVRTIFSGIKTKLETADKLILKNCRKEAVRALRLERLKDHEHHGHFGHHDDHDKHDEHHHDDHEKHDEHHHDDHEKHDEHHHENKTRPHFDNEPKPSNKNLRNLDIRSSKLGDVRKNILACIEQSSEITDNLKKFLKEYKDSELKDFFKAMKENLTSEEKNIVRSCRRQSFKSRFQPKIEKE